VTSWPSLGSLRVVSFNCNGIRSSARKGFYDWMLAREADFVCLQETKAQERQVPPAAAAVGHYNAFFLDAVKPGYSGVAIYAKRIPDRVVRGLGWPEYDAEARYLQLDYGNFSIASLYVPSGTSGYARQMVKEAFLARFAERLAAFRADGRTYVICGDYNIAHREIDVYDPVRCAAITGFFPQERAWMDAILAKQGWVDAFRVVDSRSGQYTWWSNFRQAFERNSGWRIDYQLITPDLRDRVLSATVAREPRMSDHAPVIVEYAPP
jgi:exodeoxyribonuclease-3